MTTSAVEPETRRAAILKAPVTSLLSASWVVVFLLLALSRSGPVGVPTILYGGFISPDVTHAFGDVTPRELYGGQSWRALTATFIHFNLLHLALNLIAFVQLGRVVESWYGSWNALSLYAVLGVGANLAANLLRPWVGGLAAMNVHSGGGSTVVLGLIGLVAVVGWRNPAEFPKRAPLWIAAILVANGVLGFIVPNIDNLGHLAGALMGGLVALADRRLIRRSRTWRAKLAGLVAMAAIIGAWGAQVDHRRAEVAASERFRRWGEVVQGLAQIEYLYRQLQVRGLQRALAVPPKPPNLRGLPILIFPEDRAVIPSFRAALLASLRRVDALPTGLDRPPTADAYRSMRVLASRALFKPPTREELDSFEKALAELARPSWERLESASRDLSRLQNPPPRFGGAALSRLDRRPAAPPPAGASAAPNANAAPPRTPASSGSGRGTP